MQSKPKTRWPALALFFLAPAIGELLSGSAPPAEFFNPFTLLILAALYGSGALLARELRVRWGKGWPAVFALGAAYGIVEEGLMVKSFFDPNWMDLDILGVYGRWAGVNWVWSLELTLYHAVFSIAIPILLVELLFPEAREQSWVGRKGRGLLWFLLIGDVLLGYFLLTTYRPPMMHYLLANLAAAILYWVARRLPVRMGWGGGKQDMETPRPRRLILLSFSATLLFFFINWGWPHFNVPVAVTLLANLTLVYFAARYVSGASQRPGWGDDQRLALAGGALGFFILLTPLQELDAARPDNTAGLTLVGLAALLLLFWLGRRMTRVETPA